MKRLNIAVAGTGISGLACAWLLAKQHAVTLFESDDRLGGHANTVDAPAMPAPIPIDTGFIVYNSACYPNLIALFDHLGVETVPTTMGFAVSLREGAYEYSGRGARGLFGQPSNILDPAHWAMTRDILRFFREAKTLAAAADDVTLSLGTWLERQQYSAAFRDRHIRPMAAAIWSTPGAEALAFPAAAFARFFANHGLLQIRNRPQWRTVVGGSRTYVDRLARAFNGRIVTGRRVSSVSRDGHTVRLSFADHTTQTFDHLVLACHADQALALLSDPSPDERRLLAPFRYQSNRAILHTDPRFMPRRKHLWSSWNYIGRDNGGHDLCLSYWMNALQPLPTDTNYFVTLNPTDAIHPNRTIAAFDYAHPLFDTGALTAQRDLWRLQGQRNTWFAGSYFGSGFHEDGLQAGLWVGESLGGHKRPWTVAGESDRLHRGPIDGTRHVIEAVA